MTSAAVDAVKRARQPARRHRRVVPATARSEHMGSFTGNALLPDERTATCRTGKQGESVQRALEQENGSLYVALRPDCGSVCITGNNSTSTRRFKLQKWLTFLRGLLRTHAALE